MSSAQALRYSPLSRPSINMDFTDCSLLALSPDDYHGRTVDGACRPPVDEVAKLPKLLDFKYAKTRTQVYTHRSYYARPTAVFEDPIDDIAPDNEVLEFVGDSVLSLAVATLARHTYPGLRVGPHAKIKALVVQNATIAHISEHYQLAQNLRANSSQLVVLRHSPVVQADLFEAYLGGLYVDWGYEHIRPWLSRVLLPYIHEAYRIVKGDYCGPGQGKQGRSPGPFKPQGSPQSGNNSPRFQSSGTSSNSPRSFGDIGSLMAGPPASSLKHPLPQVVQVNTMFGLGTPPPSVFTKNRGSDLPPEEPLAPPSYTPPFQSTPPHQFAPPPQSTPPRQFAPSQMAEGHLPLLNQVLQHAKRWIDWDYQLDPKSPSTTPIWDASGKMSGVLVCEGRGNTKKLAKNDAARRLVGELQARLGRSGGTTPDLAKELERWYLEKQNNATAWGEDEDAADQGFSSQFSRMGLGHSSDVGRYSQASYGTYYSSP